MKKEHVQLAEADRDALKSLVKKGKGRPERTNEP